MVENESVFGNQEWIAKVKQNERRDKLMEAVTAVFEEFGDMEPFEVGAVIHTAATVYYADTAVSDIHEFVRGAKGEPF